MNLPIPSLRSLFFGKLANLRRAARRQRKSQRLQFQPLEPRFLLSADLIGSVDWDPGAAALFPDARAEATVRVENIGDATARSAKISVYASADDVLDASDVLLGKGRIHGKLNAGEAQDVRVGLDFDEALLPGEYRLIALVDSSDRVHESDESNNAALGPVFDFSWMFGDLPGHHGSDKLTFRDADGTKVTFRLNGPGTGELTWDGSGWDLLVTGTDDHSVLSIHTNGRGDGRFSIDDVHVAGPLGGLFAPRVDLTGTLAMDEALRAGMILGSASDAIIAVPTITGLGGHKFGLQGIAVLGDLVNSQILIGADLGADGQPGGAGEDADSYGAGELGKLVIGGSMLSSEVRVGQDPVDGIFDNGNDAFFGGADSSIDAVFIRGEMSDDSLVVAGALPFKAFVDHHKIRVADDPRFRLHDQDFNQAPDAVDDLVSTDEDTEVTIAVLANDTDADGDSLAVQGVGAATNGSVDLNADGTITYSPDLNFFGVDSFTYTISDGQGGTDTATVTVTVNPVNDPPVAQDDTAATDEDSTVLLDILANDFDVDDVLTVISINGQAPVVGNTIVLASGAQLTPQADGTYLYDPNGQFESLAPGEVAADSFTYVLDDGHGLTDGATATLSIGGVNDAPELGAIGDRTVDEGTALTFTATAVDPDDAPAALTFSLDAGAPAGATIDPVTGEFSWTPTEAQGPGDYSITVRVTDDGTPGLEDFETILVTVAEVNEAPVLAPIGTIYTLGGAALSYQIKATDPDLPPNGLTYSLVGPVLGDIAISATGLLTWTTPAAFGTTAFTVHVEDEGGLSDEQTFDISVIAPPRIALDDVMVVEGDSGSLDAVFRVLLSGPAPIQGVSVNYANSGVFSALPGIDFTAVSGSVTFAHGETEQTFAVPVLGNTNVEPDEIFGYVLSSPVNGVLSAKSTAFGTILDDDDGLVRIGIDRKTVFEGDSGTTDMVFTVLLSNPSASEVTVDYLTQNGVASAGADFQATSGTLTFAAGETSATITVPVVGDAVFEGDEIFTLRLQNQSANATISNQATTGNAWIVNDDGAGLMSASAEGTGDGAEAPGAGQLQATLDAAIAMWTQVLGADDPLLGRLDGLTIALTDFADTDLGTTDGSTIFIDADAAGHGWFVDLTPAENGEFRLWGNGGVLGAAPLSEAFGRMDLLTVVLHEVGHVLGFDHEDAGRFAVMRDQLDAGTRYTLDAPKFDFASPWAGGTGASIAWDDWGIQWMPAHAPRGGHSGPHLPGFLVRL